MMQTEPQFKVGDRFFSHYEMQWGTVESISHTSRDQTHGVTGEPLYDTTWYRVKLDIGGHSLLDDAHGRWDMARMVPPHIAKLYGYGDDPQTDICNICGEERRALIHTDTELHPEDAADGLMLHSFEPISA